MTFKDIALPVIQRGIPVIRLRPRDKVPLDNNWPELATTDINKIEEWNGDFNCGAVAQAKIGGVWFFEIDKPEIWAQIETDTGHRLPKTFRVRSSPGRGHFYWLQNEKSIAMGNIGQNAVIGEGWSARVNRQFVVAANSLHPRTGLPYEIICTEEIVEAPDFLIDWCISQKTSVIKPAASDDGPILAGARDNTLASIAGKYRQKGLSVAEIRDLLAGINERRCQPPVSEDDLDRISGSIGRYKPGEPTVLVDGVPAGQSQQVQQPSIQQQMQEAVATRKEVEEDPEEPPAQIIAVPYPKFPKWVMQGTSIYEGFVKPYCAVNSRIPEFMFMPALICMLNYLGAKVRIEMKDFPLSLYMVVIGRRGDTCKSSSVRAAFDYFESIGTLEQASANMTNAEGRSVVWTVGSAEGLGMGMQRTNCKNPILYYDELSLLTSKAGIDSSSLSSNLLLLHESDKFQNLIKGKESFSFAPRTYCASLITCTTDKMFQLNWSKLTGGSTGMDDRFFFLLQPETPLGKSPMQTVSFLESSKRTRELIDRAIQQGNYRITDSSPLHKQMQEILVGKEEVIDNREETRVEKFALYFAVDLGLDEIDDVCIERALALVKYEKEVKRYFKTYEAFTKEGALQQAITSYLRMHGGECRVRLIENGLHRKSHGTSLWQQAYKGLIGAGIIAEYGKGSKSNPRMCKLLQIEEDDD